MDKEKPVNNTASGTIDGVSGHAGTTKRKFRATRKTYADLKFLCTFIADKAKSRGIDASVMTPENVRLTKSSAWCQNGRCYLPPLTAQNH